MGLSVDFSRIRLAFLVAFCRRLHNSHSKRSERQRGVWEGVAGFVYNHFFGGKKLIEICEILWMKSSWYFISLF